MTTSVLPDRCRCCILTTTDKFSRTLTLRPRVCHSGLASHPMIHSAANFNMQQHGRIHDAVLGSHAAGLKLRRWIWGHRQMRRSVLADAICGRKSA